MTKAQWAALYRFCDDNGYTVAEVVQELRNNGTVARDARAEDLSDYVNGTSYDEMIEFIEDSL